ncbi:hypothetical protein EMIT0232MI5_210035 [Pseudomonas sp. IT-232MI5]
MFIEKLSTLTEFLFPYLAGDLVLQLEGKRQLTLLAKNHRELK